MKNLIMTLVILGASSSAWASGLNCKSGQGSLNIITNNLNSASVSEGILTTAAGSISLYGKQTSLLTYEFTSPNNETATLKLTVPVKPGGGCKRCATSGDDEIENPSFYWGKLDYANQVMYFQCIPSN